MATANMPDEFFDAVAHHLPPEQPVGPKGGRPRVAHRTALRVIWFVLTAGTRWEDVPEELGCSGRTAHRRLRAWEEAGIWDRLKADLLRLLKKAGKLDLDTVIIDGVTVRAFGGGEATGPSPVDRRRPGTKHTLMVDPDFPTIFLRSRSDYSTLSPSRTCLTPSTTILSPATTPFSTTKMSSVSS